MSQITIYQQTSKTSTHNKMENLIFGLNCKGTLWSCQKVCLQSGGITMEQGREAILSCSNTSSRAQQSLQTLGFPLLHHPFSCTTVISSRLLAQQITCTGRLLNNYGQKKQQQQFNRLLALVDNPHLKSKENLYKKAPEFTKIQRQIYMSKLFCNVSCCV